MVKVSPDGHLQDTFNIASAPSELVCALNGALKGSESHAPSLSSTILIPTNGGAFQLYANAADVIVADHSICWPMAACECLSAAICGMCEQSQDHIRSHVILPCGGFALCGSSGSLGGDRASAPGLVQHVVYTHDLCAYRYISARVARLESSGGMRCPP